MGHSVLATTRRYLHAAIVSGPTTPHADRVACAVEPVPSEATDVRSGKSTTADRGSHRWWLLVAYVTVSIATGPPAEQTLRQVVPGDPQRPGFPVHAGAQMFGTHRSTVHQRTSLPAREIRPLVVSGH